MFTFNMALIFLADKFRGEDGVYEYDDANN